MSDLTRLYYLLLVANASYLALTKSDNQVENYCHLCTRHTMCRYPFDDVSSNCKNIEHGDLDPEEIISIVNQHNLRRNFIASGKEIRGNPGPQPPAKNIMELSWDDELAVLARRWALQCVLSKDECRDVTRFQVWQNINILKIDALEIDTNSLNRIKLHIKSWSDDVQNFDSAEVGLVDFAEDNRSPYIGIAAGNITLVGCGRAIYSEGLRERGPSTMTSTRSSSSSSGSSATASANPQAGTLKLKPVRPRGNKSISSLVGDFNSVRGHRLEVLVCNYGGIDRTTPRNLYEDGMPGYCPEGLTNSPRYKYLCRKKKKEEEQWSIVGNTRSSSYIVRQSASKLFLFIFYQYLMNGLLSSGFTAQQ